MAKVNFVSTPERDGFAKGPVQTAAVASPPRLQLQNPSLQSRRKKSRKLSHSKSAPRISSWTIIPYDRP
eukprot:CAMPEP_0182425466 /NCGR_PEP_ID=MMETSP1167-20130531/11906_1 /TAXON_ID=2988 /ORGANISM="Mallomonas Sp, Strain CCMP3275" /LENGTH=68 /DNA_ID=CAMNT_0024606217 /DNA_START=1542 /DNA_END=1748 /DNA_ORIENTATION=+